MPETVGLSTPALAYLGDCVVELLVREHLVSRGLSHSDSLNRAALEFVRASAQSEAVERLLPRLTEEELAVYRRGRNSRRLNFPKTPNRPNTGAQRAWKSCSAISTPRGGTPAPARSSPLPTGFPNHQL